MIIRGSKVKASRDIEASGYFIHEGTIMRITAADYETDFALFQLSCSHTVDKVTRDIEIWVYEDDFERL